LGGGYLLCVCMPMECQLIKREAESNRSLKVIHQCLHVNVKEIGLNIRWTANHVDVYLDIQLVLKLIILCFQTSLKYEKKHTATWEFYCFYLFTASTILVSNVTWVSEAICMVSLYYIYIVYPTRIGLSLKLSIH
jgi:hypothetical protein